MIGLLWYESKGMLQLEKAKPAFKKRFGYLPTVVYCSNEFECNEIEVRVSEKIPKNHFYLVKEECNESQHEKGK